jgi:hypothetical protein
MSIASGHGWFVAATFLALSGCASSSSDGASGGSSGTGGSGSGGTGGMGAMTNRPDPCTLVTSAELGALVDIPLTRTERIAGLGGDPSCTWYDADDFAVFQVGLWDDHVQYEFSAMGEDSSPLAGVGQEAHLGSGYSVQVKLATEAFFTQSLMPVADGQISSEVRAAAMGSMTSELGEYEAAFRAAKLVEDRL